MESTAIETSGNQPTESRESEAASESPRCSGCGKPLGMKRHKLQRYCSPACYPISPWRPKPLAERLGLKQRKCAYPKCAEMFTPKRIKQKYHTPQCLSKHWYDLKGLQTIKKELAKAKAELKKLKKSAA